MKKQPVVRNLLIILMTGISVPFMFATRLMENLDRGTVAVYLGGSRVYIGWRMLGTEPETIGYNIYRGSVKLNASPITDSTNYIDTGGGLSSTYRIASVMDGSEQELSAPVAVWSDFYHDIPLRLPAGGTTPIGDGYSYSPNDASVADLDGDGQYEIVLKWDPSNSRDNAHSGYTGNVYLDAYEMDGTFLWRIDLGVNIRAGAHYTQFMVYDLDSDGRAEVVCKTVDGTTDGTGTVLGDPGADWRNSGGYILDGPEYLSAFDGLTGAFVDTVAYVPPRGDVCDWGDCYGNRVDRFLACVAYLDGRHPSVVMCRGYYTRTVLAAWDLVDGQLVQRWVFDSDDPGQSAYAGQGNHNLSVADVDDDGRDEIIYGSCAIDDDGTDLYTTGLGHGDALHVSDMDPDRPGLEVFQCHESFPYGTTLRAARTGEILWRKTADDDTGRCCAAHIDARYPGYQMWSVASGGTYNAADNTQISSNQPNWGNSLIWWDGDLQREILDDISEHNNPYINKWYGDGAGRLLSLYNFPSNYGTASINGDKGNPCLSGDILGDWREEVIYRSRDNTKLRVFTSTELTAHRIYTLMHDPQYRLAVAWQNVAYNQPPHPGFYIGAGMDDPPPPDIVLIGADPDETDPPQPSPMGWAVRPCASSRDSIAMQAVPAVDPSGVEYYFACTDGPGHDSGWQGQPFYEDTGLTAGRRYTYTVTARDKSDQQNTTFASVPAACVLDEPVGPAYWDFEDGTDGTAFSNMPSGGSVDAAGGITMHGYDTAAGPSFSTDTLTGTGLSAYCDGGQDGYTVDAALNAWSPQTWTIEVAVKLNDIAGWRTFIGRDGASTGQPESDFYLQRNDENGAFRLNVLTAGGARYKVDADFAVQAHQWYRLAVTCDGAVITMYCDKLDGSGYQVVAAQAISSQTPAQNALAAGGFNWTFGRGWYDNRYTDHIVGCLDNVRFSSMVLPPEQFLGAAASVPWVYGDFSGNHFVDYHDIAALSGLWLEEDCDALHEFDVDGNCIVGFSELIAMADNWLEMN